VIKEDLQACLGIRFARLQEKGGSQAQQNLSLVTLEQEQQDKKEGRQELMTQMYEVANSDVKGLMQDGIVMTTISSPAKHSKG
jgi:hypothetical protein